MLTGFSLDLSGFSLYLTGFSLNFHWILTGFSLYLSGSPPHLFASFRILSGPLCISLDALQISSNDARQTTKGRLFTERTEKNFGFLQLQMCLTFGGCTLACLAMQKVTATLQAQCPFRGSSHGASCNAVPPPNKRQCITRVLLV